MARSTAILWVGWLTIGCDEEPSGPTNLGWEPIEYSFTVTPGVLVAPRGDTIIAELYTDAPPAPLSVQGLPPGVAAVGVQDCCVPGSDTLRFAVEPDAPIGNHLFRLGLHGDEGFLAGARAQISVVADQTGNPLALSTVVATGSRPSAFVIHPTGKWAYVPEMHAHTITRISLDDNRASRSWKVHPDADPQIPRLGDGPVDIAFTGGDTAYVTNRYSDLLSRRDLGFATEPLDVPVAAAPAAVALDTRTRLGYVTAFDDHEVTVVDLTTHEVTDSIAAGVAPWDIEIGADGEAYVTSWGSDHVAVIDLDTHTVADTVPVGDRPVGLTLSANGAMALVANSGSDDVSIIDLASRTVTGTIPVGSAPYDVAVTEDGSTAYVANSGSDDVSIVDLVAHQVVGSASVGDSPVAVAIRPDGAFLYVVNEWGDDIYVFDLREADAPAGIGARH